MTKKQAEQAERHRFGKHIQSAKGHRDLTKLRKSYEKKRVTRGALAVGGFAVLAAGSLLLTRLKRSA